MIRHLNVHPDNPQQRTLRQVVDLLRNDAVIAYPTDSGYALGCLMGRKDPLERIRRVRGLDERHHFTLVVSEFAQVGEWVQMDNWAFRAMKAATPGPYTFILKATHEVPRAMLQPRKKTVGIRVPAHVTTLALLAELGEPLVSSTLILPGTEQPLSEGWVVAHELANDLEAVLDSGDCGTQPTTVVDLSVSPPEVMRVGAGDPAPFEAA
jgi:tRNA threonylcarbamoyl adenosine modification protein (Sua5/YciO/YrdC/YwlC family)